jgi:SAM-dependent methyltransferase
MPDGSGSSRGCSSMWDTEKQRILARYDARIEEHGLSFGALASGTEERRRIRFDVLTGVGLRSGDEVLDLGCGFGDYAAYLAESGIDVSYTGYDINPRLIEEARRRHPGRRFEVLDILQESFPEFDYIVSTSCFNLKMDAVDNYDFIAQILRACYARARRGVAVDLLSSYVDYPSAEGFHYEPERILAIAKSITKRVCLRHDYPLYEFNVYLYRDFAGWGTQ